MLIRITQDDINKGRILQCKQYPNSFYTMANPISWAVARMWNGNPKVHLSGPRVFVDHTFWNLTPVTRRACIIEMPQDVQHWFTRFMKSNVEPISFIVIPKWAK